MSILHYYSSVEIYDSIIFSLGSLEENMNREGKEEWYLKKEFFFAEEK